MNLASILANKHTSIAGLVYLFAKFGLQVVGVWMPELRPKLDATAELVEGFAVAYGLFAAGDASKSLTKDEAETKFVTK